MRSRTWVIRTSADANGAHHTPVTPFQAQGNQRVALSLNGGHGYPSRLSMVTYP